MQKINYRYFQAKNSTIRTALFLLLTILLSISPFAVYADYRYPVKNAMKATIVGTPLQYQQKLPELIPKQMLELEIKAPDEIPDVFWYARKLEVTFLQQDKAAPLIFVIAGTGSGANSESTNILQKVYYQAGFHVIAIPSPTYLNFIVAASRSSVPGQSYEDAEDLYRVMELAYEKIKDQISVNKFYLTGFSLGGYNAAFVSKLDEKRNSFNFNKVLIINPPVSLFNSVSILDTLEERNVPQDNAGLTDYLNDLFTKLIAASSSDGHLQFNHNSFYAVYQKYKPSERSLESLIGIAFRFSAVNMAFTADVMTKAGYLIPKNATLTSSTSLTKWFATGLHTSFIDYFDNLMLPYFRSKDPDLSREDMIKMSSLQEIESYLVKTKKIGLMTNDDDIILAPNEIHYLRRIFGSRAKIYPTGGHGGNLAYPDNVHFMTTFFKSK